MQVPENLFSFVLWFKKTTLKLRVMYFIGALSSQIRREIWTQLYWWSCFPLNFPIQYLNGCCCLRKYARQSLNDISIRLKLQTFEIKRKLFQKWLCRAVECITPTLVQLMAVRWLWVRQTQASWALLWFVCLYLCHLVVKMIALGGVTYWIIKRGFTDSTKINRPGHIS